MAIFGRNNPAPTITAQASQPTLEERADKAGRIAASAINQFETAAQALEHSAIELESVEVESAKEAEHYALIAQDAAIAAKVRRTQAANIRALLA